MTEAPFTIRAARTADIPDIGQIVAEAWRTMFLDLLPQELLLSVTPDAQGARHERTFSQHAVHYRVAVIAGKVTGFASWGPGRDPSVSMPCELYALYLKPGYERKGIGRRLFEAVRSDAASSGCPSLYLTALSINPNRAFYMRLGGNEFEARSIQLGDRSYDQVGFLWKFAT